MKTRQLFEDLYRAPHEVQVENVLRRYSLLNSPENWRPYGGTESNFSVVENQQSSPIPALIEKITNGIDAILMRRCVEEGVDPRSDRAPRSIDTAVDQFFPNHKNWDVRTTRRIQAQHLQILADGPRMNTSLIVYDDGEGQAPEDFEDTFLSLLRGNKNEIHFVHGKYNMGGAGAVAFCGKKRYQLTASKRFDNGTHFGFTLVRRHPLSRDEEKRKKATWYEYLIVEGKIPAFSVAEMDLGLYKRKFRTGTVIKLYSYDLPAGSRSVISRDLNQSINEYLFSPALPVLTIDNATRYPDDRNLQRDLYGLKRRLEEEDSRYVAQSFSEVIHDQDIGHVKISCYVFKPRIDETSVKETRATIQREFFKNNMAVLFSVDGQVHGHYTSEFITRSLKFHLLKDYLLIHVDCTRIRTDFRNELFMASRDRLKEGQESTRLRHLLAEVLAKSRLKDIHKDRKASITVESKDAEDLLRSITRNLPIRSDLLELLGQTFKLDDKRNGQRRDTARPAPKKANEAPTFSPQRYPSFFNIDTKRRSSEDFPMVSLPIGGERDIRFSTDVEDQYFDRVTDPGELQIALLDLGPNEQRGGDQPGFPRQVDTILNVTNSSPQKGTIHVLIRPTQALKVGDAVTLRASLSSPERQLDQIFMVKITQPETKPKEPKKGEQPDTRLGLPNLHLVYKEPQNGQLTWEQLENTGIPMARDDVVRPLVDDTGSLSDVYINMDSSTWLTHRTKLSTEDAITVGEKRYVSSVYFHTLFLYTITKNRKYAIVSEEKENDVELVDYIADLFETFYGQFLLNFDTQELIAALDA